MSVGRVTRALVCGLLLAWPQVAYVSGSSSVSADATAFRITLQSVSLIPIDEASEQRWHADWREEAGHEVNALRARLGAAWPALQAAHPDVEVVPFDASAPDGPCEAAGPCRLRASAGMSSVEVVVAHPPAPDAWARFEEALGTALFAPVGPEPAAMVRDLVGLTAVFPRLAGLDASAFDGTHLHFERGWPKKPGAKGARGVAEPDAIALDVTFEPIEQATFASDAERVPGFESIGLQHVAATGADEAWVGAYKVSATVRGDATDDVVRAVRDVWWAHARASLNTP